MEKCDTCESRDTDYIWGKMGYYVSYYRVKCNACGWISNERRG